MMETKKVDSSQEDEKLVKSSIIEDTLTDIVLEDLTFSKNDTLLSFPLLEFVHEARMKHGLRRHDVLAYKQYCCKRLYRYRKQLHLTNGNGRFVRRNFVTEDPTVRYLQFLTIMIERCWFYGTYLKEQMNSNTTRRFKRKRLRHFIHRRFRKAVFYAKKLSELIQKYGDKQTVLQVKAYEACYHGLYLFELRRWELAAKQLLMAQNYTISLQRLTSTFGSSQDFLTAQMTKIKSALRMTSVFLNRQGISLEGLLPEPPITQELCTDQEMHQDIYWRGISITVSQSLLQFSEFQTIEVFIQKTLDPALLIIRSNENLFDLQLFSSVLETFKSFERCIENCSTKIRQYLLDTNFIANHTQLFVLESVFRDWSKIAAIEGQCTLLYIILKCYNQENTIHFIQAFEKPNDAFYSPHLLITITNIILQIIQALTNEVSSTCFPDALQSLSETHTILLRHFVLWTRTIRDIQGIGMCLTLNTSVTEREEVYVLLTRIMERRCEFRINEKDLMLPLKPCWENCPFSRISSVILTLDSFLDTLLSTACILNTSSVIMSQHISKGTESSDIQESLHHLSEMLPCFSQMPSLKPIPFTPITFDLASCYCEEFHELEQENFKCFSTIEKQKESTTSFVGRLAAWWKE